MGVRPIVRSLTPAAATREEMSAAKLPLAYRDSCANLLIPLNRCRYEEYYLPWKCEVRVPGPSELPYVLLDDSGVAG